MDGPFVAVEAAEVGEMVVAPTVGAVVGAAAAGVFTAIQSRPKLRFRLRGVQERGWVRDEQVERWKLPHASSARDAEMLVVTIDVACYNYGRVDNALDEAYLEVGAERSREEAYRRNDKRFPGLSIRPHSVERATAV